MRRRALILAVLAMTWTSRAVPSTAGADHCSSVALVDHGVVLFGANLDHVSVSAGLVFINPRGLEKSSWWAGTTGDVARWTSRYGSVTFNLVGYPFAWAGMNDQGLTLSTMSLGETEIPAPDERPPLDSGEWMQYLLDTCRTVEDVLATDARVRIFTVDHYLVADRFGGVAVIEFLDGEMVVHTGDDLPTTVLTNSTYDDSATAWLTFRDIGRYSWLGGSLARFCLAADRIASYQSTGRQAAIAYVFDTLDVIRGQDFSEHTSQWSLVFDTAALRAYFRTFDHREIKVVDLNSFSPRCEHPIQMLDIQQPTPGDVSTLFSDFSYDVNFNHTLDFMRAWGSDISPAELDRMLRHHTGSPCATVRPRRATDRRAAAP